MSGELLVQSFLLIAAWLAVSCWVTVTVPVTFSYWLIMCHNFSFNYILLIHTYMCIYIYIYFFNNNELLIFVKKSINNCNLTSAIQFFLVISCVCFFLLLKCHFFFVLQLIDRFLSFSYRSTTYTIIYLFFFLCFAFVLATKI